MIDLRKIERRRIRQRREYYITKFGLHKWTRYGHRQLPRAFVLQLDACADDSARRLLLGKSRKRAA